MRWLLLLLLLSGTALAERVTGRVTVMKDGAPKGDRSGVVVYVEVLFCSSCW